MEEKLSNVRPLDRALLEAATDEVLPCWTHFYLIMEVDRLIEDIDEFFFAGDAKRVGLVVYLVEDHPQCPNIDTLIVLIAYKDLRA